MKHRVASLAVVAVLTMTACSEDAEPQEAPSESGPSTECLTALEAAADEPDFDAADVLLVESVHICDSPEAWEAALTEHPGAIGLTEKADISGSLGIVCYRAPDAPSCEGVEPP